MATSASGDSAPSQLRFPAGTAALPWARTVTMHVSRSKSAKKQTPSLSHRQAMEAYPCRVPSSLLAASPRELPKNQRAALTKPAFPPARVSCEKITKLLQQVPLRSSSSLNKYRVLPSIIRRSEAAGALAERPGRLGVSEGQQDAPKAKSVSGGQGSASTLSGSDIATEESSQVPCAPGQRGRQESLEEPHMLLAVRSPSGQRFEHHFKPSDSLQTVLAVAGQKLLADYQHCRVETMEVPRRSFSDLTKSFEECGILPRSVLCIRRDEQHDAADLQAHGAAVAPPAQCGALLLPKNAV